MSFSSNDFYLGLRRKWKALFGAELPDALDNTVAIAEGRDVRLPSATGITSSRTCGFEGGTIEGEQPRERRQAGAERAAQRGRFRAICPTPRYELSVINSWALPDISSSWRASQRREEAGHTRQHQARRSTAQVRYGMGLRITGTGPIGTTTSSSERFLNPERISMPDIDTGRIRPRSGQAFIHFIFPSITAPAGYPDRQHSEDEKPRPPSAVWDSTIL